MSYVKTIVCLANSRKRGGHCVAGKQWRDGRPGPWVRPVSGRIDRELSPGDCLCDGVRAPKLLDLIELTCLGPCPMPHQPENHLIDPDKSWRFLGRSLNWKEIPCLLDSPRNVWGRGHSSAGYYNNRVPCRAPQWSSLLLIRAPGFKLAVGARNPHQEKESRVVKGKFNYRGVGYILSVTDPEIEAEFSGKPDGEYNLGPSFLCVSLGDEYKGYYYKLIAAVLHEQRFK